MNGKSFIQGIFAGLGGLAVVTVLGWYLFIQKPVVDARNEQQHAEKMYQYGWSTGYNGGDIKDRDVLRSISDHLEWTKGYHEGSAKRKGEGK